MFHWPLKLKSQVHVFLVMLVMSMVPFFSFSWVKFNLYNKQTMNTFTRGIPQDNYTNTLSSMPQLLQKLQLPLIS